MLTVPQTVTVKPNRLSTELPYRPLGLAIEPCRLNNIKPALAGGIDRR